MKNRVLIVDLNNFSRYPSIAIGYLVAVLKSEGFSVDLLAPLMTGIAGVPREPRSPWWGFLEHEFRYRTGVSSSAWVRALRAKYSAYRASQLARSKRAIVREFAERLSRGADVVLVSSYLMYYPHCVAIGEICRQRAIPMILGGPYFAVSEVAREWINMPGLTALVGGEVEPHLCEIVRRTIARESLGPLPGVWRNDGRLSLTAPPLADLDSVPFPDYSMFPWSRYPNIIVPMITGRGCGWGVCSFCSDVTSTAGRMFRSRSPKNVLDEIGHQHSRHGARLFVFTDLKLNSNLEVWRAISGGIQDRAPEAKWIGAVHIGVHGENGLTRSELRRAREAGMVRVTTGLESGSQRVLDWMAKGANVETNSRFLADAAESDISVRSTMFTGFPGETAEDVQETVIFLERHAQYLERVALYRFAIPSGTRIARQLDKKPATLPSILELSRDHRQALIEHLNSETQNRSYRRAVSRLIRVVHGINRKPLRPAARDFEGVM